MEDLHLHRAWYLEFESPPTQEQVAQVRKVLAGVGPVQTGFGPRGDPCVEVAYHRGIVDNEAHSIVAACGFAGVPVAHAKSATIYQSRSPELAELVRAEVVNPNIETLWTEPPVHETLEPAGVYEPARRYDLRGMNDDELATLGIAEGRNLDARQMARVRDMQGALGLDAVTDVLLEALDARWSDHCAHTTWASLGKLLRRLRTAASNTNNDNILSMFADNAGVWRLDDEWAIAIKGETHNGPSAVSAYFGQLTKLGGVLRDILGTGRGADPVASFEYTATGGIDEPAPRDGWPTPRRIAVETMDAIAEYGNTFGVPMMTSRMDFHPAFRGKPFAMGGSIGLIPRAHAAKGTPEPGDCVLLIGGLTGNDGIHGASASSAGAEMDATSVQIGSPLEEIMFRAAIVELRDAGCIRAVTDLGAAGLNSAVGEMGEACGVWLNTALVPLKSRELPMWRILLSESQERMALAIPPAKLDEARRVLDRHQVRRTVVGRFDGSARFTVFHDPSMCEADAVVTTINPDAVPGELGFSVTYEWLDYEPEPLEPEPIPEVEIVRTPEPTIDDLPATLTRVLGDLRVASQAYASTRYDSTVQGNTTHQPTLGSHDLAASAYWAGTPAPGSSAAALFTAAFDPWLAERHPVRAAEQMTLRAVSTLCWAGVAVRDVCLCDNFYTPHRAPGWSGWLVAMVDALAELSERLGTPFISGKDSSAGSVQTDQGMLHVPPSVYISALGRVDDARTLTGNAWSDEPDSVLVLMGPRTPALGGTVIGAHADAAAHDVDAITQADGVAAVNAIAGVGVGSVRSFMPVGSGGVAATMAGLSIALEREAALEADGWSGLDWFREHRLCVVAEVDPARVADLPAALEPVPIGRLGGAGVGLTIAGEHCLRHAGIDAWTTSFERAITGGRS